MSKGQRVRWIISIALAWYGLGCQLNGLAQDVLWQPPQQLHLSQDEIGLRPLLLADGMGRLHLLWNEFSATDAADAQPAAIYYMRWEDGRWTAPLDILTQPTGRLESPRGQVDPYGRIHLICGGVGEPLIYSHSTQSDGYSAQLWTQPIILSEHPHAGGSIALDANGMLHVVYGAIGDAIYHRTSTDWGVSWSAPNAIIPVHFEQQTFLPGGLLLAVGQSNTLHLVWSVAELPEAYPPSGIFYTRSTDGGRTWMQPQQIAPADHAADAIVTDLDGRVAVLVIGRAGVGGRYLYQSRDGGLNWSSVERLATPEEGGGLSGGQLSVDSRGSLHAVFGLSNDRIVAYTQQQGQQWSRWRNVAASDATGLEGMTLAITHGHIVHIVWESEHHSLWYTQATTGAPMAPTVAWLPLASPSPSPSPSIMTVTPEETMEATMPLIATVTPWSARTHPQRRMLPFYPISLYLIATLPPVMVAGGCLIWQLLRKSG